MPPDSPSLAALHEWLRQWEEARRPAPTAGHAARPHQGRANAAYCAVCRPHRHSALIRTGLLGPFEELELVEEQEADLDVAALWAAVEEVAPRAAVMTAAAPVVSLVPEDENSAEAAHAGRSREPVRHGAPVPLAAG